MWGVLAEGPRVLWGRGLEGVWDPACAWGCKFQGGWGSNPLAWVHGGVQGSVPHWLGLVGVIGVSVWKNQSQSCFLGWRTPGRSWQGLQLGLGWTPGHPLGTKVTPARGGVWGRDLFL